MALLQIHLISKELNRQTTVTVVLPQADPAAGTAPKCRTLWLLHGMQGDATDWLRCTSIERYAEENQLMVILPGVDNSFYADAAYGVRGWSYLTEELWQIVRAWFPCISDCREDNFVAGLSMGAGGAMKYAVNHPERFCQAVCLSGASRTMEDLTHLFFAPDGPSPGPPPDLGSPGRIYASCDDVFAMARKKLEMQTRLTPICFLSGGGDAILGSAKKAYETLEAAGWPVSYRETPGYRQEWAFWDLAIKETIESILPLKQTPL